MLTLILGGARSGKSETAERLASRPGRQVVYLAPGQAWDEEMAERIRLHRERRDSAWVTVEEPLEIVTTVRRLGKPGVSFLLDGLGVWVSNLLLHEKTEKEILQHVSEFVVALSEMEATAIVVSDEVGLGVVPATPLGRQFRDILGQANQYVAVRAERTLLVVAGITVDLKALEVSL